MSKSKFIHPTIYIHIFDSESVTTNSATVQGGYAAGALADYMADNERSGNKAAQQITTFKNVFMFNY